MPILENHFYHKTISMYTAVFGTIFNEVSIVRSDGKQIKVPIAYAVRQKYNSRLEENPDPDATRYRRRVPRLSYELIGWQRDSARAKNKMHRLVNRSDTGATVSSQYHRVPYTFTFRLDAATSYIDDLMQIVEQIVVKFNPSIQVVVKDNPDLDDQSAITLTMTDSQAMTSFEGSYEESTEITATFNFTLDGYLYMPTSQASPIQTVIVNYFDLDDPSILIDTDTFTEADL